MLAEYPPETTESIPVNDQVSASVPKVQEPQATDLQRQICQVIEEIFSDENLAKDQFLKELVEQTPERWVTVKKVSNFKKVKAVISGDIPALLEAIRTSSLLQVNEDDTKIRRISKSEEKAQVNADAEQGESRPNFESKALHFSLNNPKIDRSVYVKGFPNPDAEGYVGEYKVESLEKEIARFFEQHASIKSVKLRKDADKKFKGSAFIEFETSAAAKEICAKELAFEDNPLQIMSKRQYILLKYEEHKDEDWAKQPWEQRVRRQSPKKLVKFSNAADKSIFQVKELIGAEQVAWIDFIAEGAGVIQLRDTTAEEVMHMFNGGEHNLEFTIPNDEESQAFWDKKTAKLAKCDGAGSRGSGRGSGRGRGRGRRNNRGRGGRDRGGQRSGEKENNGSTPPASLKRKLETENSGIPQVKEAKIDA